MQINWQSYEKNALIADLCNILHFTDSESPVIDNCPESQTIFTESNADYAVATWQEPTVTDNFDPAPTLHIIEGLPSGSQFTTEPSNIHTVVYAAHDAAGNQAENCAFTIVVQGTEMRVHVNDI